MFETKQSEVDQPDAGRMSLSEAPGSQGGDAGDSSNKELPDLNTSVSESPDSSLSEIRSQYLDGGDSGKGDNANIDLNTSFSEKPDSAMNDAGSEGQSENRTDSQMDAMTATEAPQEDRSSEVRAASPEPANDALREE